MYSGQRSLAFELTTAILWMEIHEKCGAMATMDDYVSSHFIWNSHITLLPFRVNQSSFVFLFELMIAKCFYPSKSRKRMKQLQNTGLLRLGVQRIYWWDSHITTWYLLHFVLRLELFILSKAKANSSDKHGEQVSFMDHSVKGHMKWLKGLLP